MPKNITIATVLALSATSIALSGSVAFAKTKVDVRTNINGSVTAPPKCASPCDEFILPAFARRLSLAGPEGTFKSDLKRGQFLTRMEDWRRHVETYRRGIERKQRKASSWSEANVAYQVGLGKYDQFFESYQNAIAMDRGGRITYGN